MAQQINLYTWAAGIQGIGFEDGFTGLAGRSIRVNAGGTGFEYYVPGTGTVTGVTATSPVVSSGGTAPVISLAGLTGLGSAGQVVQSTGSAWSYQNSTGTGDIVRAAGPTLTGTVTAQSIDADDVTSGTLRANNEGLLGSLGSGSYVVNAIIDAGTPKLGFFTQTAVGQQAVQNWTNTALPNPVTDTSAFNSAMSDMAITLSQLMGALGTAKYNFIDNS